MSETGGTILTEGGAEGAQQQGSQGAAQQQTNGGALGANIADSDWRTEIPEDLRNEPVFSKYQDRTGLYRAHVNLEKLLGGEKIPKPRNDEDQEGWERWYKATGRPDKPDDYKLEPPNSLPDGFYSKDDERAYREWAHLNGMSQRQARNLYDKFVKTQLERHHSWQTTQKQAREQSEQSLRREWGQQYEANVQAAKVALRQFADPDYLKFMDESGAGNDPRMIRAWAKVGQGMRGETRLSGAPQIEGGGDPKAAIATFREKYSEALFKRDHPDHELRLKEFNSLFERAYGNQPAS